MTDSSLPDGDRVQILDLYGRFALAIDEGDATAWSACFSEEGLFTVDEQVEAAGQAALRDYARRHHESGNGQVRHHNTSVSVTATPGGAAGRAYVLLTLNGSVVASARYDDELVNEDGAWRFSKRVVATG